MSEDLIVRIEQEAMKFIDEKRNSLVPKVSIDALAQKVFPGLPLANARMIIHRMRHKQSNGKTRAVSLGEFVKMARALNMSPLDALGVVLSRIEETKP
jgi:hypothetical protein